MTAGDGIPPTAVEVVDKVEPLIRTLPVDKQEEIRHAITTAIAYQGPLPPPQMLAQYGAVVPDSPERIIRLLEKQTDHRIAMETALVRGQVSSTSRGQFMAFGLSVFFGCVAAWLGYHNHDWLAGVIAATTIVGLATVFVLGRRASPQDAADEEEPEPPPRSVGKPEKKRGGR